MNSEFSIRSTGQAAQAWAQEISGMRPPVLFGSQTTSGQIVAQAKEQFKRYFDANMAELTPFVPHQKQSEFKEIAAARFEKIVQASFDQVHSRDNGTIRKSDAHRAVRAANAAAKSTCRELGLLFYGKTTVDWERQVEAASRFSKDNKTQVTQQAYGDAHQALSRYLAAQFENMRRQVPGAKQAAFDQTTKALRTEARTALRNAQEICAINGGKIPASQFQTMIRVLHTTTLDKLINLSQQFTRSNIAPQITKTPAGVTLVRKAPALESLVLEGGGAKGVGNPPALLELSKSGVIGGLKQVVGTSAGALTAACLASGMSANAFQQLMDNTPMRSLAEALPNFDTIYPHVQLKDSSDVNCLARWLISLVGGGKDFSAQKAVAILDQQTSRSVGAFVDAEPHAIAQAVADGHITEQEAARLDAFKGLSDASFAQDRSDKMLTFRDLSVLHKIKPELFKELAVTGYNKTEKRVELFDSANTPDMPVALAGRISMAIPVYFESVVLDRSEYVDGGVGSNLASEMVIDQRADPITKQAVMARTMHMVFDSKGQGFHTLHGRNLEVATPSIGVLDKLTTMVMSAAAGGVDYAKTLKEDSVEIYASGPNVHVVFHGDVGTFDLDANEARKTFAKQMSSMKTLDQIHQRQNQAEAVELPSVSLAIQLLSLEEKRAVLAQGRPLRDDSVNPDNYDVAQELYDHCAHDVAARTVYSADRFNAST
ncbi:hypothetical protein D1006_35140 [Burkholderia stabilis]|uniref:PNPLA domain-containing protein n=1 Tax=Burkholderia stabilis TaxID=95485 RepID=A0A4V1PQU7_9BURK|nr:patatin-like phospholipase family protein [Burkholderia stabilis]RXV65334.1 hypothetical protein D1006_35140 [Burkholderia stabilis]